MSDRPHDIRELRLLIYPYRNHTVVTLMSRDGFNREHWHRRSSAWDLPLPQGSYADLPPEDQLWMVIAALAASVQPASRVSWAEPPEPPDGGYRGDPFPCFCAPREA